MSIFRTMNISLIASIGISLILCGAIVYYCNSRLHMVEVAIMRQNQVLSSFIANVQNELGGAPRQKEVTTEDLSTPEARASAEKIVVSDNEEDESDDDSSSESDTDSETDDVVKVISDEEINVIQLPEDTITHHIKIVDVQDLSLFIGNTNESFSQSSTIYEIDSESESESEDDLEEININSIKIGNIIKLNTDIVSPIKIKIEPGLDEPTLNEPTLNEPTLNEPTDIHEHTNTQTPLKHDQMRVDDLRKIVVDKHLSTKEEVKKLKKTELLSLLQPLEKVEPNLTSNNL